VFLGDVLTAYSGSCFLNELLLDINDRKVGLLDKHVKILGVMSETQTKTIWSFVELIFNFSNLCKCASSWSFATILQLQQVYPQKNALETSKISVWSSLSFRYLNLTFVHSQINLTLTYFKNVYLWSVIATLTEKPHQRYFQNYANIRFFADAAENAATCFGLLASHPWYYGRQWERWRILFTM